MLICIQAIFLIRVSRGKPSPKSMSKLRPHIVFLDIAMTAELSEKDRFTLLEFFKAVAVRYARTAANCTLRLSRNQSCPNPEAFVREVENTFSFWGTAEGGSFHAAECMQQMVEQVRHHQVNIDGNVCTVLVTTLVLEGWQREYNVLVTLQNLLFNADWAESFFYTIVCLMAP